jgi:hypothetical protein
MKALLGKSSSKFVRVFLLLLVVITLAAVTPRASASKRMSADELEKFIASNMDKGDHNLAEKLGQVELAEQLTEARLTKLQAQVTGSESRDVLTALADLAAFLPLPAGDVSTDAPPDVATTNTIFKSGLNYAVALVKNLPNFSATRQIARYQFTPLYQATANDKIIDEPLHRVGSSTVTVVINSGHETVDAKTVGNKDNDKETSSVSSEAEYGKILMKVLGDALKGTVRFDHWQMISGMNTAVYAYTVPQASSHYGVTQPWIEHPTTVTPAYHGEIAIKPSDGTIMRITVVADMGPKDLVIQQNLLVDYGEVAIGAKKYICPVKSVSMIVLHMQHHGMLDFQNGANWAYEDVKSLGPGQTHLNDMHFSDYR